MNTDTPAQAAPVTELLEALHAAIMNIPCEPEGKPSIVDANSLKAYRHAHRDARHAAAELVSVALASYKGVNV